MAMEIESVSPEVAQAIMDGSDAQSINAISFSGDEVKISINANQGPEIVISVSGNAEGDGVVFSVTRSYTREQKAQSDQQVLS